MALDGELGSGSHERSAIYLSFHKLIGNRGQIPLAIVMVESHRFVDRWLLFQRPQCQTANQVFLNHKYKDESGHHCTDAQCCHVAPRGAGRCDEG